MWRQRDLQLIGVWITGNKYEDDEYWDVCLSLLTFKADNQEVFSIYRKKLVDSGWLASDLFMTTFVAKIH